MTTPIPPATATPTASTGGSVFRLRNGELRAMVARVLVDCGGTSQTPRNIAAALGGRSSGAVGNALKSLADRGEAEVASTAPLMYKATAKTESVAAAIITPAPSGTARPRRPKKTAATTPPAPSGVTGTAAVVTGLVTRPNGMAYHPRLLSGMPDVTALRRLRDAGVAALLYGPPGTGKTSVVEAAFPDLLTVQGDGDTTVADFVGEYTQTDDGRYVFVHGPLVRAMREGVPLFIDDATLIPPTVLAVVYPAMDGRRQIVIKANGGEVVDAAEGFYVVAGHNPGVHGAILTDALSSRFSAQIHVSTDYDLATQLKIDRRAVKVARNLATRQAKGEIGWAPQLRELIAFQKIADVLGADAAAGNLVGIAPDEDRDTVAAAVRDAFGTTVKPLALGARI
ncbi:AAA family ATPase [Kibdelosporangium persicum]|uniref:Denitrification regulatory protein NirQ n=1 Tax=Kibdelosporangium persicum TaxID=2698649 RepID=A0ABX2F4A3_9PSEU|nr:AAA family ATPase [Kibdelosporangium persicum]NRN65747.1 Denitrification regulatory protein NirQ [Kibdelosporangium persicum]